METVSRAFKGERGTGEELKDGFRSRKEVMREMTSGACDRARR